ncbi:acyltransferase [Paenibacillus sediminis]|uniref:Surface polysaccharide O-acyltransferase-like enzyme n=1 Tax=Paenibacillus sediminis TaxID=664909 RepID=A0ABS4H1F9_9BACL|nr:acyltransferase [Paenibacillus sediminis]MBP1936306.1 surface polysaccharide O-acyltransferase-like enzyme [Paenibacillus sediminis]
MIRKQKIEEIQVLRGLAFLAVVLQHSIAHYANVDGVTLEDGVLMGLLLLISKFAVPAFIFITGMVLFYNYDGKINYFSFLVKRFKDIVVPYFIWSVIYLIIKNGLMNTLTDPLTILHAWLTGKGSYHLWYVAMTIPLYVLFPLFKRAGRYVHHHWNRSAKIGALIAAGLLYIWLTSLVGPVYQLMYRLQVPVLTDVFTLYADRNFIYFIFYFVLGAAAGLGVHTWKEWIHKYRPIYMSLFVLMFCYHFYRTVQSFQMGTDLKITFQATTLLQPWMAVFLISSVFVYYDIVSQITIRTSWLQNKLAVIGHFSYGAYLVHALMLPAVGYPVDRALFTGLPVTIRMILVFALCMISSVGVMYGLNKMPKTKWITGLTARPIRKRVLHNNQKLSKNTING